MKRLAAFRHDKESWYVSQARMPQTGPARHRLAAAALLSVAIFCIDTFTSLASAVAVLYILPMLILGEGRARTAVIGASAASLFLTLVSFLHNHGMSPDPEPAFRLIFSAAAVLTTGFLLVRQSDTRLRYRAQAKLLDATSDAIILRKLAGEVLLWNAGAERLYGWPSANIVGQSYHTLLHSRFSEPSDTIARSMDIAGQWEGELDQRRRDGEEVAVSSRWQLQCDTHGDAWAVLETNTDITARRRAELALLESEARYRDIFETQAVAVLEYDLLAIRKEIDALRLAGIRDITGYFAAHGPHFDGLRDEVHVIDANATALRLFGVASKEEFTALFDRFLPLSDEDFLECLEAIGNGQSIFERRVVCETRAGAPLVLQFAFSFPPKAVALDRVPASLIDMTTAERMADEIAAMRVELDRTMRVASIGEVSATIAHEVNQPLAAIRTYSDAALRWLSHSPMNVGEARLALGEVAAAADRAGDVVKRVRGLFGRVTPEARPVGIDEVVVEATRLAARQLTESDTQLVTDLTANTARVLGDRVLLRHSILNLLVNAIQAMAVSAGKPRRLSLRSWQEGKNIFVTIADTGPGFAPEIAGRALDAFTTTRLGEMGLGLAICRSTILAHGGAIDLRNDHDGAVVRISLPAMA